MIQSLPKHGYSKFVLMNTLYLSYCITRFILHIMWRYSLVKLWVKLLQLNIIKAPNNWKNLHLYLNLFLEHLNKNFIQAKLISCRMNLMIKEPLFRRLVKLQVYLLEVNLAKLLLKILCIWSRLFKRFLHLRIILRKIPC